jgi:hypothetical protein
MLLDTWSNVLLSSFQNLWWGVISYVPNLLVALIIFVVGWAIGSILGRWIAQLIHSLKIDQALHSVGLNTLLSRAGFRLNAGGFIGALVKWFVIIVFLVASAEVLGLSQVTQFLRQIVLGYLPNVFVAAFILFIAAVLAEALQKLVVGSAKAAGVPSARFLGGLTRWAVWVFALLAALVQLGVATILLQTVFTGLIAMLALAGGLAFGLGGRDVAARYLDSLRQEMSDRNH